MQGFNADLETLVKAEDDKVGHDKVNGNRRWQGVKEMDAAEEEYFNTSDDEDETGAGRLAEAVKKVNGVSTRPKSLVDYPDDDDDVMDVKEDTKEDSIESKAADDMATASEVTGATVTPTSTLPPERLSEKRRREEDEEEDELGKLSQHKRRSASVSSKDGGSPVAASPTSSVLRRKNSFSSNGAGTGGRGGGSGPNSAGRKIAISLAVKSPSPTKTSPTTTPPEGQDRSGIEGEVNAVDKKKDEGGAEVDTLNSDPPP